MPRSRSRFLFPPFPLLQREEGYFFLKPDTFIVISSETTTSIGLLSSTYNDLRHSVYSGTSSPARKLGYLLLSITCLVIAVAMRGISWLIRLCSDSPGLCG